MISTTVYKPGSPPSTRGTPRTLGAALNTVWLPSMERWIRFDARGNKPGVDAQFSLGEERLAFPIRTRYDEVDYRINQATPHPLIVATLATHDDALEMYRRGLPAELVD